VAVVAVEAGFRRAADGLTFVDQCKAIGVGARDGSALEFVHDLCVAGEVLISDKIFCGHTRDSFADAVPVAVIDQLHSSGLDQAVFKVIDVRARTGIEQVAVGIIRIG
jgi:hypothetical protein